MDIRLLSKKMELFTGELETTPGASESFGPPVGDTGLAQWWSTKARTANAAIKENFFLICNAVVFYAKMRKIVNERIFDLMCNTTRS